MKFLSFILFMALLLPPIAYAGEGVPPIESRARVIIDNDFGGDPDGLYQLTHHLLSPAVEVRALIASGHYANGFYDQPGSVEFSLTKAQEVLDVMELQGQVPLLGGAPLRATGEPEPETRKAAKFIVQEAMRDDVDTPLYYAAGAGLTTLAQAYRLQPEIGKRLTLVWIGGPEYSDVAFLPPANDQMEYNLGIDPEAAQLIFNKSHIPIWQVPRDAYRQTLVSYAELKYRLDRGGKLGRYLTGVIESLMHKADRQLGEAYAMGDNPLVLLTALQSTWDVDPSSSRYVKERTPKINDSGRYVNNGNGRPIRVYTQLDTRLMFEDFYAKVALFDGTSW